MEYVKLGNTGMDVSKICFGAMGFGKAKGWSHNAWALEEDEARPLVKKALDVGINFFDTAEIYAYGVSEQILGKALKEFSNRDEIVVATKAFPMIPGRYASGNGGGASRKALLSKIDRSLKNLGMDYVDLYILHRWDYGTPIEETMETFNDIIKSGKVRYIGASSMLANQFQKAQYAAEKNGFARFISMQNHLNLIYREEEREMMQILKDQNVASTPYSPLASGRLARDVGIKTNRSTNDAIQTNKYASTEAEDRAIIERVAEIAEKRGILRSQVALAWLLHKPAVASPVVGITKDSHIMDAVGAIGISLSPQEILYLEEMYVPHRLTGPLMPEPNWIHAVQVSHPPQR